MEDITAKEFYDKIAEKYEKEYKNITDIAEDKMIMKLLNVRRNSNILDLGCGTGLFLEYCKDSHFYFGIDASRNMIKIAEKKHSRDMINFEDFRIEDINIFENGYYNYIISLFGSLNYIEDMERVIRIAYKKLCRGGRLFFMVYSKDYRDRVRSHNINGKKYHITNLWGYTKRELEDIIKRCGIENYKITGFRMINNKIIDILRNKQLIKLIVEWEYKTLGKLIPDKCHFLIMDIRKE